MSRRSSNVGLQIPVSPSRSGSIASSGKDWRKQWRKSYTTQITNSYQNWKYIFRHSPSQFLDIMSIFIKIMLKDLIGLMYKVSYEEERGYFIIWMERITLKWKKRQLNVQRKNWERYLKKTIMMSLVLFNFSIYHSYLLIRI